MNEDVWRVCNRPAIGFIVEGDGEYAVYPSLVARVLKTHGLYVRVQNAAGFSNIHSHLEELLTRQIALCHPLTMVIALDAQDPVRAGLHCSCEEARQELLRRARRCIAECGESHRYRPVPLSVEVVMQVPVFESWLLADLEGLRHHPSFHGVQPQNWANVDADVANPRGWLRQQATGRFNTKRPHIVKGAFDCCSVSNLEAGSRSFRKLAKELRSAYATWEAELRTSDVRSQP